MGNRLVGRPVWYGAGKPDWVGLVAARSCSHSFWFSGSACAWLTGLLPGAVRRFPAIRGSRVFCYSRFSDFLLRAGLRFSAVRGSPIFCCARVSDFLLCAGLRFFAVRGSPTPHFPRPSGLLPHSVSPPASCGYTNTNSQLSTRARQLVYDRQDWDSPRWESGANCVRIGIVAEAKHRSTTHRRHDLPTNGV